MRWIVAGWLLVVVVELLPLSLSTAVIGAGIGGMQREATAGMACMAKVQFLQLLGILKRFISTYMYMDLYFADRSESCLRFSHTCVCVCVWVGECIIVSPNTNRQPFTFTWWWNGRSGGRAVAFFLLSCGFHHYFFCLCRRCIRNTFPCFWQLDGGVPS